MGTSTYGSWRNSVDEALIRVRGRLMACVAVSRSASPNTLFDMVNLVLGECDDLCQYLDEVSREDVDIA